MQELVDLTSKLLQNGDVNVVIGYEEGPRGVRPVVAATPDDCRRLIFDHRAVHNLATYLSPRRKHLRVRGRAAVVLKGCDAAAVATLLRERQLKRDDVVLIGVRCGGVYRTTTAEGALSADNVADRCGGCALREPTLVDHLVGDLPPEPPTAGQRAARIAALEDLSPAERFDYWRRSLADCVRCNACRAVCPLCVCERCVADKTDPQWIESSPHLRGNFSWHMARALHLAGRCVDCGECQRACPAGIPLTVINGKVGQVMGARFGFRPTDDPDAPAPIGTFDPDDSQEFIR